MAQMTNKKFLIPLITMSIALIAVVVYLLTTQQKSNPNDTVREKSAEILLAIEATGGLCPYGGCYSKIEIQNDGSYTYEEGGGKESKGGLVISDINRLEKLIKDTNFTSIKSHPFSGECPTAYDGPELTYTFYPSKEVIATCTYAIDENSPLFKLIGSLLSTIYSKVR